MSYSYDMYLADRADGRMGVNVDRTTPEYMEEVQQETCTGSMALCDDCEDCFACYRSDNCFNCIGAEDSTGCSNCTGAYDCIDCKDCYKISGCSRVYTSENCKSCDDCRDLKDCEHCDGCHNLDHCEHCYDCRDLNDCSHCYDCHDLNACKYCWGCSNLTGKQFMINNSYFGYITLERELFVSDSAWERFQSLENFAKYNDYRISTSKDKITITDSAGLYFKNVCTEIKIPEVGESFN